MNPILFSNIAQRIEDNGRRITRLAFWNRLTPAERVKIDLASERPTQMEGEAPEDFMDRRVLAASLRDMHTQVNNATFIDLDRPDTRAGVQQLELFGLLDAGRALQILDSPVQEAERYNP